MRRYVTCGEPTPKFHNAKVYSLAKLDSVAKHELFITSDADVRVTKDYLRRMVQNLKDPRMGLASCVYLGTTDRGTKAGFSSQLDAVGKSVEMTRVCWWRTCWRGRSLRWALRWRCGRSRFRMAGGFAGTGAVLCR